MDWSLALKVAGLLFAALDFFGLSNWLEHKLNRFRLGAYELIPDNLRGSPRLPMAILADFWCQMKGEFNGPRASAARREWRWIIIALLLTVLASPFAVGASSIGAVVGMWFGLAGFIAVTSVLFVLAWVCLERYLIPYGIWLPLHVMNMAPKGMVGSLGLALAVAGFFL
ncbi:MAG: hypothetical protein RLZ98_1656 [Pseudomonadota bacterium]